MFFSVCFMSFNYQYSICREPDSVCSKIRLIEALIRNTEQKDRESLAQEDLHVIAF